MAARFFFAGARQSRWSGWHVGRFRFPCCCMCLRLLHFVGSYSFFFCSSVLPLLPSLCARQPEKKSRPCASRVKGPWGKPHENEDPLRGRSRAKKRKRDPPLSHVVFHTAAGSLFFSLSHALVFHSMFRASTPTDCTGRGGFFLVPGFRSAATIHDKPNERRCVWTCFFVVVRVAPFFFFFGLPLLSRPHPTHKNLGGTKAQPQRTRKRTRNRLSFPSPFLVSHARTHNENEK